MTDKYLIFNLEDDKARKLGEIIANPTCKKIVNFLAEKEASESDIAKELEIPINTVEYNLKKLLEAGIIEKSKNFFWSEKGKKMPNYKIVNKMIVISPRKTSGVYNKLKGIIPVVLISGLLTGLIGWFYKAHQSIQVVNFAAEKTLESRDKVIAALQTAGSSAAQTAEAANRTTEIIISNTSINPWIWFAIGAGVALIAFLIWNYRKL